MGFYFRKSARFGPFRVNLSKSGVGMSVGIPGFRIGTGPRGNYVHAGAHGFYYRAALSRPRVRSSRATRNRGPNQAPQPQSHAAASDRTLGAFRAIESGDIESMGDSSSEAILEEIRQKHGRIRWWRGSAILGGVFAFVTWSNTAPEWVTLVVIALATAATLLTFRWDLQRKLTILQYELNPAVTAAFAAVSEACTKLQACKGIWHLKGQTEVLDRKYHAGAAAVVSRAPADVGRRLPPYLLSNIDPIVIMLSQMTLYCFPDRILVYRDKDVGAVAYDALTCQSNASQFIEDGTPPADAKAIGHTWRYVNKDGGPDRRFNNNRQLAICRYDEMILRSGSGLNEILQLSRAAVASDFAVSVKKLTAAGMGVPAGRDNSACRNADVGRIPETLTAQEVDRQATAAGRILLAAIAVCFAAAGGMSAYYHNMASEPGRPAPQQMLVSRNGSTAIVPHVRSGRSRRRPRIVKAVRIEPVARSSAPATVSGRSAPSEPVDLAQGASPPSGPMTDDLAAVRAKDPRAAERIAAYCTSVASGSANPAASESACHRDEIAAWIRFDIDREFPQLDAATLAKCSQPPFPDSYEGREACVRYELHVN